MQSPVRVLQLAVLLMAMLACAVTVEAQNPASVQGHLYDPNGKIISGLSDVFILLTEVTTGENHQFPVTPSGEYSASGLAAGSYAVSVPLPCCMYQSFEQKSLKLAPGQMLQQDLEVGWGMNLGTLGDDPGMLAMDMRARAGDVSGPTPRTPDGKPDLSGVWVNLPDSKLGERLLQVPMKPWASEIQKQLGALNVFGPATYCLPEFAVPTMMLFPYKFVQNKETLVQLVEFMTPGYRQIFLDGRQHPASDQWNPAWMGHSVGTWDGDTLVIDTVGFNEITPITPVYGVHSEQLHIVERITRPDRGRLDIQITASDPEAWTDVYQVNLTATLAESDEIHEYVCTENASELLRTGSWKGRP